MRCHETILPSSSPSYSLTYFQVSPVVIRVNVAAVITKYVPCAGFHIYMNITRTECEHIDNIKHLMQTT